ncbi:MAG TPA: alkaline phosphatase family protein, partial [Anaerolineales bacterium]
MLALLLAGCVPLPPAPPPTAAPFVIQASPSPAPAPSPTAAPTGTPTAIPRPSITRVVIISIDGLRPDAIDAAPMPVLQELLRGGAYSLSAQTVMPSTTLPAHTSMLSGLCPSAHGIT